MRCRVFPQSPPPAVSDWSTRCSITYHPLLPLSREQGKLAAERREKESSLPRGASRVSRLARKWILSCQVYTFIPDTPWRSGNTTERSKSATSWGARSDREAAGTWRGRRSQQQVQRRRLVSFGYQLSSFTKHCRLTKDLIALVNLKMYMFLCEPLLKF